MIDIVPTASLEVAVAEDELDAGGENPDGEPYEPPRIDLLGTVAELTRGPVGAGGDLNGFVISF
jgi:hypothetical protein